MPAHKMGRQWKFKTDEVDEWVKACGRQNKEILCINSALKKLV